jgi:hypothetical protein
MRKLGTAAKAQLLPAKRYLCTKATACPVRALISPTSSAQNFNLRLTLNPFSSNSLEARAPGETDIEGSFLAGLNPSFKLIPGLSPIHRRVV